MSVSKSSSGGDGGRNRWSCSLIESSPCGDVNGTVGVAIPPALYLLDHDESAFGQLSKRRSDRDLWSDRRLGRNTEATFDVVSRKQRSQDGQVIRTLLPLE